MYQSTRNPECKASAKQAVLQGIAPDGGLFVDSTLGKEKIDLDRILKQNYLENAAMILESLLDDYLREEIEEAVKNAYSGTFASEDITPLVKVGDHSVLELFHGPTSAFKDVALTLLPQLMSKALAGTGEKVLILTATSGDTGKAALSGFQDVENTGICVFYPHGKVSAIQQKQMASQKGNNVSVTAIEGNFDDAQSEVKRLFLDEDLNKKAAEKGIRLSSANSINIGRLVPQIVYYFEAYKDLVKQGAIQPGQKVVYSVPTGNFGDVLAGYYASLLGLPVEKFLVASNANNVLYDFLSSGTYDRNREFVSTISPSMDILISSNLERLLYYMSGKDEAKIAGWMKDLAEKGSYQVDEKTLENIQELFVPFWSDDDKTRQTIDEVFRETGYVLDPHSAVAYRAAMEYGKPAVVLSTASPYKFSQDVLEALDETESDEWKALKKLSGINPQQVPVNLAELEEAEILHSRVVNRPEMAEVVEEMMEKMG